MRPRDRRCQIEGRRLASPFRSTKHESPKVAPASTRRRAWPPIGWAPAHRHRSARMTFASRKPPAGGRTCPPLGSVGRSSTGGGLDELDHFDPLDSAELGDELLKPGGQSFCDEDLKALRFVEVGVKHRSDFVEAVLEHREVRARIPLLVDDCEDHRGVSALSAPFCDIDELPQRLADRFAPTAIPAPLGDLIEAPEN